MILNNEQCNYICTVINIPNVSKFIAIQRFVFIYLGRLISRSD